MELAVNNEHREPHDPASARARRRRLVMKILEAVGWLAALIILALASRAVFAHGSERRTAFATEGTHAELAAQLRVHTFSAGGGRDHNHERGIER